MGFLKEFKEFAMQGSVMNLAIGVIIGGAFGAIVSSLVDNILMPIIGMLLGDTNYFSNMSLAGIPVGKFIQAVFNFLIIAVVLFMLVRAMKSAQKAEAAAAPPAPPEDVVLLREIRDALKR